MAPLSTMALLALTCFIILSDAVPAQFNGFGTNHFSQGGNHFSHGGQPHSQGGHHSFQSASHIHQSVNATGSHSVVSSTPAASSAAAASSSAAALDPNAANCQVVIPSNALTAEGLSTPWELLPPCSQAVSTQQAFAEAAVIDSKGQISIYHPLIIDQGKKPQAAPVVPNLDSGSQVALFFGFNGDVLTLVDSNGQDTNASPILKRLQCVNGLQGAQGDVFGQVSWCNTQPFWSAANAAVQNGELNVPALGTNDLGKPCLSARSFEIIDQDQSDNLPTKYLLLSDGSTVQFTAANQAKFAGATEIDNASDEALIADFVDPAIGCTPFQVDSIDDPGAQVSSLATNELQALFLQKEPVALIPLNDPDTVLTANGEQSSSKTNAYRIGVNQPQLGSGSNTDDGSGVNYCNNMVNIQPPFLASFQDKFTNAMTPDAGVGNNLFTFLCNRFLQSLPNLGCQNQNIPVKCTLDGDGAATACTIGNNNNNNTMSVSSSAVHSSAVASQSSGMHSSFAHSQSSVATSSAVHSQSSGIRSSLAHSQSSVTASSAVQSQSSTAVDSAVPSFSSTPHGFGNYSAPAGVNRAREVRQTAPTLQQPSAVPHRKHGKPWFV